MTSPIDRAARALILKESGTDCFDSLDEAAQENVRESVRVVLEAIREPSHSMQSAAFAQKVSFRSVSGMSDLGQLSVEYEGEPDKGAATIWQAMIDAALSE